jgi:transcription-repair coupling factor (superfamily II helicase)
VLDVWPVGADAPVRVEWFDDEVDRVRPHPVDVLPAAEAVLDATTAERAAAYVHDVARERGVVGTARRDLLADLRGLTWSSAVLEHLPALVPLSPVSFAGRCWLVEPEACRAEAGRFADRVREGFAVSDPEDRPLVRIEDRWNLERELEGEPVRAQGQGFQARGTAEFRVGAAELAPVARRLRELADEGLAVTVTCQDPTRAGRIAAIFAPHGVRFDEGRARTGRLALELGDLPEGFVAESVAYITADEIFGERLAERATASAATKFRRAAVQGLASLARGDLVVHSRHGIGAFRGLSRLPMGESQGDFVLVEYRGGDKLYVPVSRLDLLAPYKAGGETLVPRLDRLGGATWEVRKAKVRAEVLKLAAEMLRIHARRRLEAAHRYVGRDALLAQFEETFPWEETPDQQAAIEAVLEDLAAGSPMDRLVVGDVGFGKTEVAMRAAFRVVEEGHQVLVLCPTTVLAFQHHATFTRRFAPFPVRVEMVSRFRDGASTRSVLAATRAGSVDILIGTTKALGRDVRFRRLGLVVVDEEHRFGAKQKEELKRVAHGVHLLSMSATPIPRTLHMALAGLRELTVIATPPEGRQPIRTEVMPFSAARIREEILQELARGGQVFFVHNRVQSIDGVATWLRRQVPEARVAVAHGQLADDRLERVLAAFAHGDTNVLVTTAIIESGVDMPSVNCLIVNRAEQFGLAQLYQLRGRIGRSPVAARCALLVGGAGRTRKQAVARLRALEEHTALGSGFALASEDLEQRGAGDLLGERQHGHIAAIGLDAYVQLLEEASAAARGEVAREQVEPEVEIPGEAWIPEDYLPDVAERLDAYQRLARAPDPSRVRAIVADMERSLGPVPDPLANLAAAAILRLRCRELGIERCAFLKLRLVVDLHPQSRIPPATLDRLAAAQPARFRRTGRTFEMRVTPEEAAWPLRVAEAALKLLAG